MISKTRIDKRKKRKTNPELVQTILIAKKNNLLELAKSLSGPRRKQISINLDMLEKLKEDRILVAGKILGYGNINKKIMVIALSFSESAAKKLKKANCEFKTIKQEIEKNPKLTGFKIIK
jgi:large subunit ribosomal protein L18e